MAATCILCGAKATETVIGVDVDTGDVNCEACGGSFTAEGLESHLAAWAAILPWIKAHPANRDRAGGKVAG